MGRHNLYSMLRAFVLATTLSVVSAGFVSIPAFPLAVKSPYLSEWLPGNQTKDIATAQPFFWAGQNLTHSILARVDGTTYTLFGVPSGIENTTAAKTVNVYYTSSHSVFELTAGNANITLDFFSPVLPGTADYLVQSLPYSYFTVSASGTDGSDSTVQILSAIDQTWTAQNGAANLNFTAGAADFFQFYNPKQIPFTEVSDMATYGSVVFATTSDAGVSHSCGVASSVYSSFIKGGSLDTSNSSSTCSGSDLAALAKDLGSVGSATNVTFAVGFDREQAINYLNETQTGYYRSKYPTVSAAVEFFLSNYPKAVNTSYALDSAIRSKSEAVSSTFGSQYADIVEASVRQTFGAIELTVPESNLTATPYVFLKEISSDGNVNTIDVIFQSWPIFISLNPMYIRYLLQPIIDYLETGGWPEPYVVHDLGSAYPNATGHNNGVAEQMPLFETSSLFILIDAYQKFTNDSLWASQYLPLLQGYAEYLIPNSLYPSSQLISVDAIGAQPNQTGLAIQSTIGLKAASVVTGNSTYASVASNYANVIYNESLGLNGATVSGSSHFTYYYDTNHVGSVNASTWNVLFAAYSDVLLGLQTFPSSAWELQSSWYETQIQQLGLPFAGPGTYTGYTGSGINWALSDWNLVAAGASSATVQEAIVNTTHAFLTDGLNTVPFGTKYYVDGSDVGLWISNKARSTVGSDFSLLALQQGTWGTQY